MNELERINEGALSPIDEVLSRCKALTEQNERLIVMMRTMADSVLAANTRMAAMEKRLDQMATVNPAQQAKINRAIKERGERLAGKWSIAAKTAAAAIRKDLRATAGIRAMRDIPQCRYQDYLRYVETWEDYRALRGIRDKMEG